jgi:hypothetical protein
MTTLGGKAMLNIEAYTPPAVQRTPVRCTNGHRFVAELPCHVTAAVQSAALRAVACPTCGAGYEAVTFDCQ